MAYVLAALMAALSFFLNRILIGHFGLKSVVSYSPAVEETAKTIPAHYLGADIILTHVCFGALEGAYDWLQSPQKGAKAALLSLAGHTLFGVVTSAVLYASQSIWFGLASGIAAHLLWNLGIVRLYAPEE